MASYAQHALGTSTQSAAVALAGGEGKGKSGAKRVPVLEPVTFRPDAAAAARLQVITLAPLLLHV